MTGPACGAHALPHRPAARSWSRAPSSPGVWPETANIAVSNPHVEIPRRTNRSLLVHKDPLNGMLVAFGVRNQGSPHNSGRDRALPAANASYWNTQQRLVYACGRKRFAASTTRRTSSSPRWGEQGKDKHDSAWSSEAASPSGSLGRDLKDCWRCAGTG